MQSETEFDFSTLLKPYCSLKQQEVFVDHLKDHPVSSFLLNTYTKYQPGFSFITQDKEDSLLYRFDKNEILLGKSAAHFSGAFYILDPSSATISYYLKDLLPKNYLGLDLCGAPGGKSISLAMRRHDGFLLCNDISYQRAQETKNNLERLGLINILATSIDPLEMNYGPLFDVLLLDVPCSGSGMIRKESKMKEDWSREKVERLLPIQKSLLEKAYTLLKKDGILAYSTCSLSIEEDENQIQDFLSLHQDMEIIPIRKKEGMVDGVNHLGYHMIPGIFQGEGIYFCLLKKTDGNKVEATPYQSKIKSPIQDTFIIPYQKNSYLVSSLMKEEFLSSHFVSRGVKLYDDSPHPKCEYDHSYSKIINSISLIELDEKQTIDYVKGNEIRTSANQKDGLVVLTYKKARLGFGKKAGNRIKNYLPKGLRQGLLELKERN